MQRPMPETMGTGFGLNLPFTRTPQERAVEGLERKRKQEEAIKEKAGQVVDAVRGTGAKRLAGSIGGGMVGSAIGTAVGGPVGGLAGSFIGSTIGEKAGEAVGGMREKRIAGDLMRTAFGGGAITGDSADRRSPTEEIVMGNPMAHPMAADSVKMPQDLQAGYMHMNRFGSPLPIHGLGTPGRTAMAHNMQDQNFMAYHNAIVGMRNPVGMMEVPFGGIA